MSHKAFENKNMMANQVSKKKITKKTDSDKKNKLTKKKEEWMKNLFCDEIMDDLILRNGTLK